MNRFLSGADRLEVIYLATLRIIVLIFATVALAVAGFIALDGLRSFFTSTKVETEKVTVAASEVAAEISQKQKEKDAALKGEAVESDAAKKAQAGFLKGPFKAYYGVYRASAAKYNKPEDAVLSAAQLADELGYSVEAFSKGEDPTVAAFASSADFSAQITTAAKEASASPVYVQQLVRYHSAEKTAKSCSTQYVNRRVWDSYSTACDGWWQSPVGCPAIRPMPTQVCQPAYPDGITGPSRAFADFDGGFRALWLKKADEATAKADVERARREALKGSSGSKLMQAVYVFGGFLTVMFLFLVIAVERHLRRLTVAGSGLDVEAER